MPIQKDIKLHNFLPDEKICFNFIMALKTLLNSEEQELKELLSAPIKKVGFSE
jgi:hypothetical protein